MLEVPEDRVGNFLQIALALGCVIALAVTIVIPTDSPTSPRKVEIIAVDRSAEDSNESPTEEGNEQTIEITEPSLPPQQYRLGRLLVEVQPAKTGIETVGVYRDKRLILTKSKEIDFTDGDYMWLGFPHTGMPTTSEHTFDGDLRNFIPEGSNSASTPFIDFNGDRRPELVVCHNNGNASEIYDIYTLGKRVNALASFEALRSTAEFMDVDQDGKCEVMLRDPTFFGWITDNASSPMPLVILKFERKKFRMATKLMRAHPPSKERREKLLTAWSSACDEYAQLDDPERSDKKSFSLPPIVWTDMLYLIYSGNSKTAFQLLDQFWPKGSCAVNLEYQENSEPTRTSKRQFKRMLLRQLRHSPYLRELKQLNQGDRRIVALHSRNHAGTLSEDR